MLNVKYKGARRCAPTRKNDIKGFPENNLFIPLFVNCRGAPMCALTSDIFFKMGSP